MRRATIKNKNIIIGVLLFTISASIMPSLVKTYKYKKEISPLLADINKLPNKIKKLVDIKKMPKHLALIIIHNGNITYSSNCSKEHVDAILMPVLQTVKRIMMSNSPIADGYYFIATADGIHGEYCVPLLAFAGDAELVVKKQVILLPDFEAHKGYKSLFNTINSAINRYPWLSKKPYIFWRGSPTGEDFSTDPFNSPRLMFMKIVSNSSSYQYVNASFTSYYTGGKYQKKLYPYLKNNFHIVESVSPADSLAYKYLLDIDGHSCSYSRMAWILTSNSLLFKVQSNKIQWYYNQLFPYIHYVPIKQDFSDLSTQYEWAESNQEKVQLIIKNARYLADKIFTQDAIDEATRKAFQAYYELMH